MTTPLAQRLDAALYILHLVRERLPISSIRDIARGRGLPTIQRHHQRRGRAASEAS